MPRVLGLEGDGPAGGEEEGVLRHEAHAGVDIDSGLLDESAGVQVGPGIEGGFGVVDGDAAQVGGVPALGAVEVLLVDDGLVSDGQDVVGDVEQWGVGDGLGVEVPQLLGVGDVEALKGLLDGAPGGVAGLGVSIGAKTQCGVDALAGALRPGVQESHDESDADGTGQGVGGAVVTEPGREHARAYAGAGRRRGGRALPVQTDGFGGHRRGQPVDLGQRIVADLVRRAVAAAGQGAHGGQSRERRE